MHKLQIYYISYSSTLFFKDCDLLRIRLYIIYIIYFSLIPNAVVSARGHKPLKNICLLSIPQFSIHVNLLEVLS